MPVFYILRGDVDSGPGSDNISELFPILSYQKDRWVIRFDGKKDIIFVEGLDEENTKKAYIALMKINFAVERLLQEGKIENIGLTTGQFMMLNNRATLHGRKDTGGAPFNLDSSSNTKLFNSNNKERRVARMLSGTELRDLTAEEKVYLEGMTKERKARQQPLPAVKTVSGEWLNQSASDKSADRTR